MAKRTIEALLLSRDGDLADLLDEVLKPIGVQVVRNAPPIGEGARPPQTPMADDGPPLLIVDGRDYLGACLLAPKEDPLPKRPFPTLLLTTLGQVEALPCPLNADEVMCLPLRPEEVRLRVRHLLGPPVYGPSGRLGGKASAQKAEARRAGRGLMVNRGLRVNEDRYEISLDDKPLDLTFREYELLKYLMAHPGRTFTRESLLAQVWGEDYLGGTRTVDVHIRRLRMKIETDGRAYIKTVRSVGYRFVG